MEMSEPEKRIFWLDIMKGVGILLVVLQHCLPAGDLSRFILAFHMPLFFFASGIVYKNNGSASHFCVSKLSSLFLPLFCVAILNFIISTVFVCFVSANLSHAPLLRGGWFVEVLLCVECIYFLLDRKASCFAERSILLFSAIVLFALCELVIGPSYLKTRVVFHQQIAAGCFFFMLGNIGRAVYDRELTAKARIAFGVSGIAVLGVLGFCTRYNCDVLMNDGQFGAMPVFIGNACLGIAGVFCLSRAMNSCGILQFFGRNSLLILFTHPPIMAVSGYFLYTCMRIRVSYFASVLIFFLIVLLELIIIPICNRFFPWITGKYRIE